MYNFFWEKKVDKYDVSNEIWVDYFKQRFRGLETSTFRKL